MRRFEATRAYQSYRQDMADGMAPDRDEWERISDAHDQAAEAEADREREREACA